MEEIFKCTKCDFAGIDKEWENTEVGCEDCGSHKAKECPNCGAVYDTVFDDRFC